jgi:hypothetical protein
MRDMGILGPARLCDKFDCKDGGLPIASRSRLRDTIGSEQRNEPENTMINLEHSPKVTMSTAMGAIFDACRANPNRLPCKFGSYTAKFNQCADGKKHVAIVRDAEGEVIALAQVDEFDC